MSSKFKHNKKRNSGLVYEFLMRKVSESLIDSNRRAYSNAMSILKRYYYSGSPIDEERQLFDGVMSARGSGEHVARRVIKEAISRARTLDHRVVDIKKSNMLRDIHRAFGSDFFSEYKMDDYRAYASMQMLINNCDPKKNTMTENVQRIQLEEALISFMTRVDEAVEDTGGDRIDDLVYSMAVDSFNKKYKNELSNEQRRFLSEYTNVISSKDRDIALSNMLTKRKASLLESMRRSYSMTEMVEDSEMTKRMHEAERTLEEMDTSKPSIGKVEDMMLYLKLVEEIESNG